MTETHLYLLRHAESTPSADAPEINWLLCQSGAAQAQLLIDPLMRLNIDKVFSSPYRRALDTVAPYCKSSSINIQIEADLRERKLSQIYLVSDWNLLVETAWQDFNFALPDCESGFSCQDRLIGCVTNIATSNLGLRILISSHGIAIKQIGSITGLCTMAADEKP